MQHQPVMEVTFQFEGEQIGALHTGRETGLRSENRVAVLHKRISLGKSQISELHDIIPGAFRKHKGVGIKFQDIESILTGGMTARITRQHRNHFRSIEIKYNQSASSQILRGLSSVF